MNLFSFNSGLDCELSPGNVTVSFFVIHCFFQHWTKNNFCLYWREFQYYTLFVLGTKLDTISLLFSWCAKFRVFTKISSCWVNTTSRRKIKQLVVWSFLLFYFSSVFLWKYPGATFTVAGGNLLPPPLIDSPLLWQSPSNWISVRLTNWSFIFPL